MDSKLRENIAREISQMSVVNHHEHAWRSFCAEQTLEFDLPFFLWKTYLSSDLAAIGYDPDPSIFDYLNQELSADSSEKVWADMKPFLEKVRNNIYFRYHLYALKDLFDVTEHDVFSNRWQEASRKMRYYSREHKGRGSELCELMGVDVTVLDANIGAAKLPPVEAGNHNILHIARMDMFIHEDRGLAETLEAYPVKDFDPWLETFDQVFHKSLEAGAVGFKSGLAYNRRIAYSDPSDSEAAGVFHKGLLNASSEEKTTYQDFMMNRLCKLCIQADVPLQIHTGILAGKAGTQENSRPTLLAGLLQRHMDLRVDLFHGGYPWCVESGIMAKTFPNVYIDGCWLTHISPSAYRAALTSWIETVPGSKILAWGGDHAILEQTYSALVLAKDLITDVLVDLVERDYFDMNLALDVARRILHDNGIEFWRIES